MTKVLRDLGSRDRELSILFTDDAHIAQLNEHYLGKVGPTNVLAFPMSKGSGPGIESGMLGDVVVSVDRAIYEAQRDGRTVEETICRLLIHGTLHLLDFDHEISAKEARRMEKEEERLLALVLAES